MEDSNLVCEAPPVLDVKSDSNASNFSPSDVPIQAAKKRRGPAQKWNDYLIENGDSKSILATVGSVAEVLTAAKNMNLSKSTNTGKVRNFGCRIPGCKYKLRFVKMNKALFMMQDLGDHVHTAGGSTNRGLTDEQKAVVKEAFECDITSCLNILKYFRMKRDKAEAGKKAPDDPDTSKLRNYIAQIQKQRKLDSFVLN